MVGEGPPGRPAGGFLQLRHLDCPEDTEVTRLKQTNSYLESLQPGLLLLQRLLLLLLIHAAEGHPSGGERGHSAGQRGRPA